MTLKIRSALLSLMLLEWAFSLSPGHCQDKVRLGYSGLGSGEEIHHLAKDLGFFRKYNVEVETIRIMGGATIVQSIIAGELQFGRGSANEVVSAHLGGFPMKILSAVINKFIYSFITPMEINKPEDLRGRAVAIAQFGDGSDFITRMALQSWGLQPGKDVTILQVGNSPERLAALTNGKVHGAILSLSQAPRAKKLGLKVLADLSQIDAEYPQGVLYAPQSLIDKTTRFDSELLKSLRGSHRRFQDEQTSSF